MGLFSRGQRTPSALGDLKAWAAVRSGIEAYVEPPTAMSPTTLLLIADDGEFVRRPISSVRDAEKFARRQSIPLYDVNRTGYPNRMREYAMRKSGRGQSTNPFRTGPLPRSESVPPAPAVRAPQFNPAMVKVLAQHAGVEPPDSPTIEDLRRLLRAARARVHPDRTEGDRVAWDRVEDAARTLGLR